MPIHDWKRVLAGTFHDFHQGWVVQLRSTLNDGLLPPDYYAQVEQGVSGPNADVLTLHEGEDTQPLDLDEPRGTTAVAMAPPRVKISVEIEHDYYIRKQSRVGIRHASDDRIIAVIEIMSFGNKSSAQRFRNFVEKALDALDEGCHLLIVDPYPPTKRDPQGIHGVIWDELGGEPQFAPSDKPLTLASYVGALPWRAYVEPIAVGDVLIPMPLFLSPTNYISVPLEETYQQAYRGVPQKWKKVLEQI
ncbi:MAG: DUF4058 family protein [Pirellulaceae bacterium]|nr:DUF4058 family protein [Pirellulaceae bacterium]